MDEVPSVERIWERSGRISKFVEKAKEELDVDLNHERVRGWHRGAATPPVFVFELLAKLSEYPLVTVIRAYSKLQLQKESGS